MGQHKLEPSKELLEKVKFIAGAKAQLPISERGHLNDWGVYCRVNSLPDGTFFYQAGGKFIARLRFAVEKNGSITVRKYKPGDWERKVEPTCDMAKFWMQNIRVGNEIEELLVDASDTNEKIRRLEGRASERPNEVNNWSVLFPLYFDVGRFKDAEKAAINTVEAWPSQDVSRLILGRIYFIALINAKRIKAGAASEKFLSQYGARLEGLTLETLGYAYEEARYLAERHLREALKLAPPKNTAFRKVVEGELSNHKLPTTLRSGF